MSWVLYNAEIIVQRVLCQMDLDEVQHALLLPILTSYWWHTSLFTKPMIIHLAKWSPHYCPDWVVNPRFTSLCPGQKALHEVIEVCNLSLNTRMGENWECKMPISSVVLEEGTLACRLLSLSCLCVVSF